MVSLRTPEEKEFATRLLNRMLADVFENNRTFAEGRFVKEFAASLGLTLGVPEWARQELEGGGSRRMAEEARAR